MTRRDHVDALREAARLVAGSRRDYDPLLTLCAGTRFVLLGEATHGSHELYRERARITQRLVAEQGFNGVVVEADWPDADRAGRWALGRSDDGSAAEALLGFCRFPSWVWRNTVTVEFLGWLRAFNASHRAETAFLGMDLYGLYASIDEVVRHLAAVDPAAADRARARYACFGLQGAQEGERYGQALRLGVPQSCENAAVAQLLELQRRAASALDPALFSAGQNARLARNAEAYYRALFTSRASALAAWNLRDRHLADTLEAIAGWLRRRDGYARIAVWAHNSHLGDARATEPGEQGELNVGQLLREAYGDEALLVGFTTFDGTVTAAPAWGEPPRAMAVRPALVGSVEELLHEVGLPRFFLPLRGKGDAQAALREPRLERAIGVVYRPHDERRFHYFEASLGQQFDALVHVDRTRALQPLEHAQVWTAEPPETWPPAL